MDIGRVPSSSNPTNELPYNIFISCCGPDTRKTLAASTYNTFKYMGFKVFIDTEELQLGDSISTVVERAIRSSFLCIAILSPAYVESPWCLSELSYMFKTAGKAILPVFYNVDPSDIRWICEGKGIYAKAFSELKARYRSNLEDWKGALEKVSNLRGHIVNNEESESVFLEVLQETIRTFPWEKAVSDALDLRKSEIDEEIQRLRNISSQRHYIQQVVSSALSVVETPSQQVIEILLPAVSSLQNQGNDGRTSSQNDVENRSGEERPSQQVEEILLLAGGSPQNQENDGQTRSQNDVENPRSGSSRTQIKEAVEEKWKYVNCSLVLVGISLTFFSSDLRSHTHLSPILVEITLLTVCVILGVLFFMIYDKIMKEHRVRRGNNEAAVFLCKPHQLIILALSSCVASAVYIYFAINELKKK